MERKYLVPAVPGTKVPDPQHNDFLPEEGRELEITPYWSRRMKYGEVVVGTPPKAEAPAADGPKTNRKQEK